MHALPCVPLAFWNPKREQWLDVWRSFHCSSKDRFSFAVAVISEISSFPFFISPLSLAWKIAVKHVASVVRLNSSSFLDALVLAYSISSFSISLFGAIESSG